MYYRIIEVSSETTPDALTFVRVRFWLAEADYLASEPYVLVNDFRFGLRNTVRRIVVDGNGWLKRTDSTYLDPALRTNEKPGDFEWHDKPVDVPAKIRRHIIRYWGRAQERNAIGDETAKGIERDARDPHGILVRQDVKDLQDTGLTVEGE